MQNTKIIAGLGNPGKKYKFTRHNIGELILGHWQKAVRFSDFKSRKKLKILITKGNFEGKKIILVFPQTFMNLSGKPIKSIITKNKIPTPNLWVIHDDIDLALGEIKIVKNKGAAGHKGVQSIIDEIKTKNFIRFRIGIRPESYPLSPKPLEEFVLQKFTKEEKEIIKEVVKKTIRALKTALKEGPEKAMNEFN